MKQFQRQEVETLLKRLDESPRFLILVSGPRQSGKTTVIRQALAQIDVPSRYLAADQKEPFGELDRFSNDARADAMVTVESRLDIRDQDWLIQVWQHARERTLSLRSKFVLALDEIQVIPNWSQVVKGLWDEDRHNNLPMHVVLLGSAPLVMQRGLTESLAGRFETIQLAHWSFKEMRDAFGFSLEEHLYFGGYPGTAGIIGEQTRWRDYVLKSIVEPNIERDVLAMERVDKPVLLKRLVDLGAEFSGQELSYTKMLGQLDDAGNTTTLTRYLDLLEKSGILCGLQKYEGITRRLRASSPKLNMLNTALMSAISAYDFQEARADRTYWGRLVETAIGAHLVNTSTAPTRVHYWRENGNEVDFVLARGSRKLLIEVTSGNRPHRKRGIQKFEQKFGKTPYLLVGGDGMDIEEFLSASAQDWIDQTFPNEHRPSN